LSVYFTLVINDELTFTYLRVVYIYASIVFCFDDLLFLL